MLSRRKTFVMDLHGIITCNIDNSFVKSWEFKEDFNTPWLKCYQHVLQKQIEKNPTQSIGPLSPGAWFVGHGSSNLCGWRCPLSASGGVCLCTVINAAQPGLRSGLGNKEEEGDTRASRYTNNDLHRGWIGVGTNSGRHRAWRSLAVRLEIAAYH